MTKREWQIEMANRFAKRGMSKELEAKLECYERLVDSINMASNPMSVKSREALKNVREMKTIMTKEALAQPEQEPVAWWNDTGTHIDLNVSGRGIPLYTTLPQRKWVGLTDEERYLNDGRTDEEIEYAKAIEAKLKEKNT